MLIISWESAASPQINAKKWTAPMPHSLSIRRSPVHLVQILCFPKALVVHLTVPNAPVATVGEKVCLG